jgi:hypothetical protein
VGGPPRCRAAVAHTARRGACQETGVGSPSPALPLSPVAVASGDALAGARQRGQRGSEAPAGRGLLRHPVQGDIHAARGDLGDAVTAAPHRQNCHCHCIKPMPVLSYRQTSCTQLKEATVVEPCFCTTTVSGAFGCAAAISTPPRSRSRSRARSLSLIRRQPPVGAHRPPALLTALRFFRSRPRCLPEAALAVPEQAELCWRASAALQAEGAR